MPSLLSYQLIGISFKVISTYNTIDRAVEARCMQEFLGQSHGPSTLYAIAGWSKECKSRISYRILQSCLRLVEKKSINNRIQRLGEDLTIAKHSAGLTLGGCHERKQGKCATEDYTDPWKAISAGSEEDSWSMPASSETIECTRRHEKIRTARGPGTCKNCSVDDRWQRWYSSILLPLIGVR